MTIWQPIDSAPRDGTRFLAADFSALEYDVFGVAGVLSWHRDGYYLDHGFQYVTVHPEPTHWMPLPPPPQEPTHD